MFLSDRISSKKIDRVKLSGEKVIIEAVQRRHEQSFPYVNILVYGQFVLSLFGTVSRQEAQNLCNIYHVHLL